MKVYNLYMLSKENLDVRAREKKIAYLNTIKLAVMLKELKEKKEQK